MISATPVRSYGLVSTPLGRMLVVLAGGDLVGLHFVDQGRPPSFQGLSRASSKPIDLIRQQLSEYFHGERTRFELPVRLEGTAFQIDVWSALLDLPYGQTSSYGRLARQLGRPRAARAVGAANGQNPISIIVPCHRLVGADGRLTGYGGGLNRKQRLLELEGTAPVRRTAAQLPRSRSGG